MKKLSLIAALFAASALPFAASAQTANTINFTGTITKAACSVSSAAATGGGAQTSANGSGITVNMGTVADTEIGTIGAAVNNVYSAPANVGSNVTLTFNCSNTASTGPNNPAVTAFSVAFEPTEAQKDANVVGALKLSPDSAATGVAIALFDNGKLVNVHDRQTLVAGKIQNSTGTLDLRAMYVRSGTGAIGAGSAKASLPFTVRYQ